MKIDIEHIHYWMQAIRQSTDPIRTMDAFWSGQLKSKEWLVNNLARYIETEVSIDINGGWVGTLASLIFQSDISCSAIRSIDIDPDCEEIAKMMNKKEEMQGRFTALTSDMCAVFSNADVVINTSCEHITQHQYNSWLKNIPQNSLLVLQSNNYDIPEHIRTAKSLEHFKDQCGSLDILWNGALNLPLYKRWMIIGTKF